MSAPWLAPPDTCRLSRFAAPPSIAAPTSSASAPCSTRCSRGVRAFQRDTTAETMTAILHDDPPENPPDGRPTPPALDRIVHHCLEKSPGAAFPVSSRPGLRSGVHHHADGFRRPLRRQGQGAQDSFVSIRCRRSPRVARRFGRMAPRRPRVTPLVRNFIRSPIAAARPARRDSPLTDRT